MAVTGDRLTALARQAVGGRAHAGDRVVDATVGNGHDTLFLARQVSPGGRVVGFDIQQAALDSARRRLSQAGLEGVVDLRWCGHERMSAEVPANWSGTVAAVMFNLGYLPGGDRAVVTHPASTCAALGQATRLLRVHGLISLLLYRGHAGATSEAAAVTAWLRSLDRRFLVTTRESPGPVLFLIERLG